ncbi:hypothetical protein HHK36_016546 [Tetracentron sinense]|uniref:HECT-type E3 ubiquitin transferase n=1 Tax=Tetracentron sinense TaxID=13715 RepID=A0A834Z5H2_TETSI|nr:hypothetical protein HHK36_016546 [Tetracentron sinense]
MDSTDSEVEINSSASEGYGSESEAENDSGYGSCDSDGPDGAEQRHLRSSSGNQDNFQMILSELADEAGPSSHLAALTELCDVLSFTEHSLSSFTLSSLAPVLVKLAQDACNPDVILMAVRAITYLSDMSRRSSRFLVQHDAVPALCSRLMVIEYLDVAEQCLQALEKLSRDHPLACLRAGAIMAVLNYIDFFSTSVQRVALSTVSNICEELPSDCSSPFMEAVPILCNLLRYEDRKLVENVAMCLIRIVKRVSHSSEMLGELCKHGVIHQATHLIALNSKSTLSEPIYNGLIGLLARLASVSVVSVRTLIELNISNTLKHILSNYDRSHGVPCPLTTDENSNQIHEVLKLLYELLPPLARNDQNNQLVSDKEKILVDQPELLRQIGMDILPVLIQVSNSDANLSVCYGCLSVINKVVYFGRSDLLLDLLKNTNISSFLAGVFTRKDHHVLNLALKIAETVLRKLPDSFLNSFVKEGVVYAIDALLMPEKCSQFMFPVSGNTDLSFPSSQKPDAINVLRCLCYAFDTDQNLPSSETVICKLEKDSVHTLAKHIKDTYFATELLNSEIGLTDIIQKLRTLSVVLTDKVNMSFNNDICAQHEENLYCLLNQINRELNGGEPISTFEFIESRIVKSLANYLSNGQYLKEVDHHGIHSHLHVVAKRFEMFAKIFLSSTGQPWENIPLAVLIRKLQSALSSLENFPVILSYVSKTRKTYATIPTGRYTTHPCLKVHFVREEGETDLCDYSVDVITVEPFSSWEAIERFLLPKVSTKRAEHQAGSADQSMGQSEHLHLPLPSDSLSPHGKCPNFIKTDSMSSGLPEMQEDKVNLSHSAPEGAVDSRQAIPAETSTSLGQTLPGSTKKDLQFFPEMDTSLRTRDSANATTPICPSSSEEYMEGRQCLASYGNRDPSPRLVFYLEGRQMDQALTLYQEILQQVKAEQEINVGANFWNEVYKVTYRKGAEPKQSNPQECLHGSQFSPVANKPVRFWQNVPFLSSMLVSELACGLEKSNPTYDILFLLKSLEGLNRFSFHLMSHERRYAYAEGRNDNWDYIKEALPAVPHTEFVNSKLTEKLEQQMRDPLAVSIGGMPSWCSQLMASCPFLFGFEARCKYFRLASQVQPSQWLHLANNSSSSPNDRRPNTAGLPRKKFQVCRSHILDSAAQMMDLYACNNYSLEVEYNEEVGTGLGPTMEFYTLVSHEFQKVGLGMWRADHSSSNSRKSLHAEDSGFVVAPLGLFPRPWSAALSTSNGIQFSSVIKKFVLLGQVVAKSLQDGRVMDLPFSKAFYKLILEQVYSQSSAGTLLDFHELDINDIQSFDPELGRVFLEFQALVDGKHFLESGHGKSTTFKFDSCFRNTRIEDLCLDFTLPGYPDYMLTSGPDKMVNMINLEEYVSLTVDATVNSGIFRQVEAFKSGFNQVFPIKSLQIFTEEELERLLCGEQESWASNELLDHIKFDHGYTVSSPPIINFMEIIQEFERDQRRAFLQFVTGAPRLPQGGLSALNPKLTIVRKHCDECADDDLPSVMTCANYLKLPPYSSKERMRERLLYAIKEGQGSFHLS